MPMKYLLKRISACLIALLIIITCMGCSPKSKAERELEAARKAAAAADEAYNRAAQKYDDLKHALDSIDRKTSKLNP